MPYPIAVSCLKLEKIFPLIGNCEKLGKMAVEWQGYKHLGTGAVSCVTDTHSHLIPWNQTLR